MTQHDKEARADDIIGLMAGFGFTLAEARQIGHAITRKLISMNAARYNANGADVGAMAALLDKRDNIEQDAAIRSRVFHEPQGSN